MSEEHPHMSTPTPEQLRHLLLHRLTAEEAERVEEQLMQDAEAAELLRHEETDLVDDYAQGGLAADDRVAFERHLLVDPHIRQRVKVARALHALGAKRGAASGGAMPSRGGTWSRGPIRAAAVIVLCAVAVGLVLWATRRSDAPPAVATHPTPDAPLEEGPEPTLEPSASIVLLADVQRGGQAQVVRVRAGAGPVRLQAEAMSSDSSLSYRLSITDESGRSVFNVSDLRPQESGGYVFVEAAIPAGILGTGPRIVTLDPQRAGVDSFTWRLDVQAAADCPPFGAIRVMFRRFPTPTERALNSSAGVPCQWQGVDEERIRDRGRGHLVFTSPAGFGRNERR